jgi:hypothetical protein
MELHIKSRDQAIYRPRYYTSTYVEFSTSQMPDIRQARNERRALLLASYRIRAVENLRLDGFETWYA